MEKRGQVTIFVIIAVVIVAGILIVVLLKPQIFPSEFPKDFQPAYNYFTDCVGNVVEKGISIQESQGGYISLPKFEPGSDYAPFSSQFNFLGFSVPYWYYVSGNGIIKDQVPTKSEMEKQLANYIQNGIEKCNLANFASEGLVVTKGDSKVSAKINDNDVVVNLKMDLSISKGETKANKNNHEITVKSKLGKFYNQAVKIYNEERKKAFLENYGVDVMTLYAPVTGAEFSCSPKIWNPQDVVTDIREGLEANTMSLKISGDYYKQDSKNKYFVLKDVDVKMDSGESVNFLYSKEWPSRIQVWPVTNGIMVAKPAGMQQGMGVLGFCYVPYHFVYDIYYPTLIQIYDDKETFQFPVAVIIDKSVARKALEGTSINQEEEQLCRFGNTQVDVSTLDNNLDPVEAEVYFKCFNIECDIGKTIISGNRATLSSQFPQCINGYVTARAEGYADGKTIISTNVPGQANILMNKLYELDINLKVDNLNSNDMTLITFSGDNNIATIIYPDQKKIKLSEDDYEVTVDVYSNSKLTIPESTTQKCLDIPQGGLFGFFGATKEKCIDITIPGQELTNVVSGGGKTQVYILDSQLRATNSVELNVPKLPTPKNLDDLSKNYETLDTNQIDVELR